MRLRIKLDVTTEIEPEKIRRLLQGIEKGGKIKINEGGIQIIEMKPKGKPGEIPFQIIEHLQTSTKSRSATQIAKHIERLKPSVNAALKRMKEKGHVTSEWDARWRVARYTVTEAGIEDMKSYIQAKADAPANAIQLRKWIAHEGLDTGDEITHEMLQTDTGWTIIEYRTAVSELLETSELMKTFSSMGTQYWVV